jgi:hypothetical protein
MYQNKQIKRKFKTTYINEFCLGNTLFIVIYKLLFLFYRPLSVSLIIFTILLFLVLLYHYEKWEFSLVEHVYIKTNKKN